MSRRYAIFDAAHLGPQLDVTRGGIVLTTLVPGLSIARTARLTVPAQDFESFAEFIVYGKAGTIVYEDDWDKDTSVMASDQGGPYVSPENLAQDFSSTRSSGGFG